MSIWLCRAGRFGEHEARFLENNKIYFTFEEIDKPLNSFSGRAAIQQYFLEKVPTLKERAALNFASQAHIFGSRMSVDDWVITPSKNLPGILHFGKIVGEYAFDTEAEDCYRHSRSVEWFSDVPKSVFEQDIQYSLGAAITTCQIKQEARIKKAVSLFRPAPNSEQAFTPPPENSPFRDIETESLDAISDFIIQNFKGDGLAHIVAAILRAKGFVTYVSPKGPDHGVDILASAGSLGFSSPKICVQVKSTNDAIDRIVLDQLIGTMANAGAEYGLLVSWSGFRSSVERERAMQFFKVRLWSKREIIEELLACYSSLDDEIKQKIPLKRIWTLDIGDE